jgi:hypothetical protein
MSVNIHRCNLPSLGSLGPSAHIFVNYVTLNSFYYEVSLVDILKKCTNKMSILIVGQFVAVKKMFAGQCWTNAGIFLAPF